MLENKLQTIEAALNRLDAMASSCINDESFYTEVLDTLRATLDAVAILYARQAIATTWLVQYSSGQIQNSEQQLILQSLQHSVSGRFACNESGETKKAWYANTLPLNGAKQSVVICVFAEPLNETSVQGLNAIVAAFMELIAIRQTRGLEDFAHRQWPALQKMIQEIGQTNHTEQAAIVLVNGLANLLGDVRVSLFEGRQQRTRLQGVSGVAVPDKKSLTLKALESLASQVIRDQQPIIRRRNPIPTGDGVALSEDGTFHNAIFLRFDDASQQPARWVLGIEFPDEATLIRVACQLPQLLPMLQLIWQQSQRLMSIPAWARTITQSFASYRVLTRGLLKLALFGALFAGLVYMLIRPQSLRIEAQGALLPIASQSIFAIADGYVVELFVQDSQPVEVGQRLLRLKSPSLEIQIEELESSSRSLDEEARGLKIALNQLNASAPDFSNQQSLMASKLTDIEIQKASLKERLVLLQEQIDKLNVVAPIAGNVIGRDLQQRLAGRPVARGDTLFQIMNLKSDWEIRTQVADRDSAYVLEHFPVGDVAAKQQIEFIQDGAPNVRHSAELFSIANRVENNHRTGCFLEVRAKVSNVDREQFRVGSNVHAYFDCGPHPTWFVWLRPLIEAMQRKHWF